VLVWLWLATGSLAHAGPDALAGWERACRAVLRDPQAQVDLIAAPGGMTVVCGGAQVLVTTQPADPAAQVQWLGLALSRRGTPVLVPVPPASSPAPAPIGAPLAVPAEPAESIAAPSPGAPAAPESPEAEPAEALEPLPGVPSPH
jgi:hypothetical protein